MRKHGPYYLSGPLSQSRDRFKGAGPGFCAPFGAPSGLINACAAEACNICWLAQAFRHRHGFLVGREGAGQGRRKFALGRILDLLGKALVLSCQRAVFSAFPPVRRGPRCMR